MAKEYSAEIIAQSFIKQYYEVLANRPEFLYRFYKDDSQFSFCDGPLPTESVLGVEEINKRVRDINFTGTRVDLSEGSIDAQKSDTACILIVVTGELSLPGKAARLFVQTFFLAGQGLGTSFYCRNSVLRLLAAPVASQPMMPIFQHTPAHLPSLATHHQQPQPVQIPVHQSVAVQPVQQQTVLHQQQQQTVLHQQQQQTVLHQQQQLLHQQQQQQLHQAQQLQQQPLHQQLQSVSVSHHQPVAVAHNSALNSVSVAAVVAAQKHQEEQSHVEANMAATLASLDDEEPAAEPQVEEPPPVEEPKGPRSYLDMAKRGTNTAATRAPAPTRNAPVRSWSVPASQLPSTHAPASAPAEDSKPASAEASRPVDSKPRGSGSQSARSPYALYINKIPTEATSEEVRALLSDYPVKHFEWVGAKGFAFADMDSDAAVKAAVNRIADHPLEIHGVILNVEEKKPSRRDPRGDRSNDKPRPPRENNIGSSDHTGRDSKAAPASGGSNGTTRPSGDKKPSSKTPKA